MKWYQLSIPTYTQGNPEHVIKKHARRGEKIEEKENMIILVKSTWEWI